jgi:hypothetical protein
MTDFEGSNVDEEMQIEDEDEGEGLDEDEDDKILVEEN